MNLIPKKVVLFSPFVRYVTDATVAIFVAVLLFVFPSEPPRICCWRSRSFNTGQLQAYRVKILHPSVNKNSINSGSLDLQPLISLLTQHHVSSPGKLPKKSCLGASYFFLEEDLLWPKEVK